MLRKGKLLLRIILLSFFIICLHGNINAQPAPDDQNMDGSVTNDDPGDPGDPGNDPDLPIDSNVFILVAAGVGYGLKKRYDLKQAFKRKNDNLIGHTGN